MKWFWQKNHKIAFKTSFSRLSYYLLLLSTLFIPVFSAFWLWGICSAEEYYLILGLLSLFSIAVGTFVLFAWEKKMKRSVLLLVKKRLEGIESTSGNEEVGKSELQFLLRQKENEIQELKGALDQKIEESHRAHLKLEDATKELRLFEDELTKIKEQAALEVRHKDSLLQEYQRTISEQRAIIEKKQRICDRLENKVQELVREIKSLLQLEDTPKEKNISQYAVPSHDLSAVLKRYVEKAENLTGVGHLGGGSPRFLDLSLESFAVDKRRLSDSFSDSEEQGVVFIYSPSERKFLFMGKQVKILLGHGVEKFMQEFPHFVTSGYSEWKGAIALAHQRKESHVHLMIQNRLGKNVSMECLLSPLSKGPFAQNILGLLSPNE